MHSAARNSFRKCFGRSCFAPPGRRAAEIEAPHTTRMSSTAPVLALGAPGTTVAQRFAAWNNKDLEAGVAVAAVRALLEVLQTSQATTIAQLVAELHSAARELEGVATSFATKSGCSLFTRIVSNSMGEVRCCLTELQ